MCREAVVATNVDSVANSHSPCLLAICRVQVHSNSLSHPVVASTTAILLRRRWPSRHVCDGSRHLFADERVIERIQITVQLDQFRLHLIAATEQEQLMLDTLIELGQVRDRRGDHATLGCA